MGSGPGRLLRGCEEILDAYELHESATQALLVLEADALPTDSAVERLGNDCGLSPENLTVCVARTASLAGSMQIVARSIETTMHKLHELKFDLEQVQSGVGWAPLPPLGKNDLISVGWTNDSIIFGASVFLTVDTDDEFIDEIGRNIPSESSSDFGRPFIEIFEAYDRDFYRIDKLLFSPARVTLNNVRTGKVWEFGRIHEELLRKSWGL
jgi:methenyltetrahydromethanopterin cyclohydrolase